MELAFQEIDLGHNYRMTDIQAALGLSQLKRLDQFVAKRQYLASRYQGLLSELPLTLPFVTEECYSAFHLYVVRLQLDKVEISKRTLFEKLKTAGIGVNLHYIPVYKQPYYQDLGFPKDYCPEAERYYAEAISLPLFPELKQDEQDYVANTLSELLAL